jgi:hypothetical protein
MKRQLGQFVERASEIVGAYGNFQTAPENVEAETIAAARCELIRQVFTGFAAWAYQRGAGGHLHNLGGNCMVPAGAYIPWSHAGKRRSETGKPALTRGERAIMRAWLIGLRKERNGRKPPFFYDADARRWFVDTVRYPDEGSARAWWEVNALTPAQYLSIAQSMRGGAA